MKNTLTLLTLFLTTLMLAPLTALHATDAPKQNPNIIHFLIDDLGWRDLGCQGSTYTVRLRGHTIAYHKCDEDNLT